MSHPGTVIAAIVVLAALYVLFPVALEAFRRFRGRRTLRCPETQDEALVETDGLHAALTSAVGRPHLRAKSCSLWPGRMNCGQGCLSRL